MLTLPMDYKSMKPVGYIYILLLLLFAACGGKAVSPELEQALYHFYMGQTYQQESKYYDEILNIKRG